VLTTPSSPPTSVAAGKLGFVYVATGTGYLDEARRSAESLRRHHPVTPICLITDQEIAAEAPFDHVVLRRDAAHKPIDKTLALHCPFERTVFLDTDTRVFGDLTPLFAVLEQFDLALLQDVNRGWNYELPSVPACFSEFNTGVIAFRRTPAVTEFFQKWRDNHAALARDRGFVNDQPAFRQTLYRSSLRVAPLPSEFHFLANFPNALLWKVRLIHARGDLDRMAGQIDEQLGTRVYIPEVGVVGAYAGRKRWLKTSLRTAWRLLRLVLRPPADSAAANPRKWWRDESPKP
jgi:Nucleotide-diphospho-sugar transferase